MSFEDSITAFLNEFNNSDQRSGMLRDNHLQSPLLNTQIIRALNPIRGVTLTPQHRDIRAIPWPFECDADIVIKEWFSNMPRCAKLCRSKSIYDDKWTMSEEIVTSLSVYTANILCGSPLVQDTLKHDLTILSKSCDIGEYGHTMGVLSDLLCSLVSVKNSVALANSWSPSVIQSVRPHHPVFTRHWCSVRKTSKKYLEAKLCQCPIPQVRTRQKACCGCKRDQMLEFCVFSSVSLFSPVGTTNWYGVPWEFILCWQDTFKSRWLMYKVSNLPARNGHIPLSKDYLDKLYSAGDSLLAKGGNKAYKLIKLLEPLAIGKIQNELNIQQQVVLTQNFYKNMVSTGDELSRKLDTSHLWEHFYSLIPENDWPRAIEVYGMYRHWGHPIIDVQDGLLTLKCHSTIPKVINHDLMIELASKLNKLLLEKYYHTHLEWPPGSRIPPGICYQLEAHIRAGTWPTKKESLVLPHVWHYVEYDYIFEIPTVFPPELLFDDKAHSLDRPIVEQAFEAAQRGKTTKPTSARVIKTALATPDFNVMELLKLIDSDGLSQEDLIIGLKPKEREVNTRGRMFSLMSFKLRAYIVATEWLIAKYILPIFPEVTMLNSLTDLMEKFSSLSQRAPNSTSTSHVKFNIHLDYTKWNNHQRYLSTAPVFKIIDRALGFKNLITRTHEFFENSLVYYGDDIMATCVNDFKMYQWSGHCGGFEGLRQKGWSVIGALILRNVGERCNQKFSLLIQGDNQVVTLQFDQEQPPGTPESEKEMKEMSKQAERVLSEITAISSEVGLITKPEETWISSGIMLYGKYPIINGQTMPSWAKKISRMYDTANDVVPTLHSALSSNVTACLTLAQQGRGILRPLALCYWSLYRCILKSLHYDQLLLKSSISYLTDGQRQMPSRGLSKTPESFTRLILDIMTRDTVIGGLGGCSPIRFLARQFVDPLCETLTALKIGSGPLTDSMLTSVLEVQNNPALSTTVDWKNIIEDPTSLNLTPGGSVSSSMQQIVLDYIMSNLNNLVKNQSMKVAFNVNSQKSDVITNNLAEWSPMVPKFLANVYDASLYGMVSNIVGRVQNTRSLTSDAISTGPARLINKLRHAYIRSLNAFFAHHSQTGLKLSRCSYKHSLNLTKNSWKREDIIGVRCPHPLEQFVVHAAFDVNCKLCMSSGIQSESILMVTDPALQLDPSNIHKLGSMMPTLGSETAKYKPALRLIRGRSDVPYVDRVLSLYDTIGWFVKKDSPVHESINNLLASFTTFNAEILALAPDSARGDPCHRYGTPRESMGCFSPISFTPLTHMSFNTNRLQHLGKGERNRLILFQAVFITFQTMIVELIQTGHAVAACYHLHPRCMECLEETPEVLVDSKRPPISWPQIPSDLCKTRPALSQPDYVYLESVRSWSTKPLTQMDQNELTKAVLFTVCLTWMGKADALAFYGELDATYLSKPLFSRLHVPDLLDCLVYTTLLHSIMKDLLVRCDPHNLTFSAVQRSAISNWVFTTLPSDMIQYFGDDKFATQVIRLRQTGSFSFPMSNDQVYDAFHHLWITKLATTRPTSVDITQWTNMKLMIFKDTISFRMGRVLEAAHSILQKFSNDEPIVRISREMIQTLRVKDKYCTYGATAVSGHILIDAYARDGIKELCNCKEEDRNISGVRLIGSYMRATQIHIMKRDRKAPGVTIDDPCVSPLGHFVRGSKGHTSAYTKVLSLMELWNDCKGDGIVCGDGTGGFAGAVLSNMPNMRLIYNSLSNWDGFSSQAMGNFCPASVVALDDDVVNRVINRSDCAAAPNDLLRQATYEYWRELIKYYNLKITLIICDAETLSETQWLIIIKNLIDFCKMSAPGATLIAKGHYNQIVALYNSSRHNEEISKIISISTVWRSPYSQWGKSEVYLCLDHAAVPLNIVHIHSLSAFNHDFCSDPYRQIALVNNALALKTSDPAIGLMGVSSYAVKICCTHPRIMGLTDEGLEQVIMMLLQWSVFGIQKDLLIHRKISVATRMRGAHRSDFRNVAALQTLLYVLVSALCSSLTHYSLACALWNQGFSQVSLVHIQGHGHVMEVRGTDFNVPGSTTVRWAREAARSRPLLSYLGLLESGRTINERLGSLRMHMKKLFRHPVQQEYVRRQNGSLFSRIMAVINENNNDSVL